MLSPLKMQRKLNHKNNIDLKVKIVQWIKLKKKKKKFREKILQLIFIEKIRNTIDINVIWDNNKRTCDAQFDLD